MAGVGEPVFDELAGPVDRVAERWLSVLAFGELPGALELDRGARERVREQVVQLAGDPAALGDRRRAGLLIARVLELRQQDVGLVLALPRLLEELRNDTEQDRHQHPSRDSGRGSPGDRCNRTERDRHPATDRDTRAKRQPRDRHEHRDAGRDLGRALELKSGDRHAGRAHHRDHDCLQLDAPLGKAVADRDHERHSEHQQRQRHGEPLAVQSGDRVAVGAAEHHHEQHRPAERPQRPSLPMQALMRSRPSLRDSLALRDSRSL